MGHFAVARGARILINGIAVPIYPEPSQAIQNGVDRRLGGALAVGVLDPQQHGAAAPARVEPIEQRGARATDVQEAGGRRRETGDDGRGHIGGEYPARFNSVAAPVQGMGAGVTANVAKRSVGPASYWGDRRHIQNWTPAFPSCKGQDVG